MLSSRLNFMSKTLRVALARSMSETHVQKSLRTNPIEHNAGEQCFSIPLNSDSAQVMYKLDGDIYDLHHSDIPFAYQGQGLGSILAERVLDHLVSKGKKIRLSCDFLNDFYEKNKSKYRAHIVD